MSDEPEKGPPGAPTAGAGGEAKPAPTPAPPTAPRPAAAAPHADADKHPWEVDPKSPEWSDAGDDPLAGALKEEFGDAIESARNFAGDLTLAIRRDAVGEVAAALKAKHRFTYLVDVCGADYPKRAPRFDVVYHLHRFDDQRRVRLRVTTDEATPVPTVSHVWRAANWPEREVYDMYGVRFAGHPDMSRILLWEGFNGYPLRKDFPVEGIDTGSAIYPEYYEEKAGPVSGTGTGWRPAGTAPAKPAAPPKPAAPAAGAASPAAGAPAAPRTPLSPEEKAAAIERAKAAAAAKAAAKAAAPPAPPPADGEPPAGS